LKGKELKEFLLCEFLPFKGRMKEGMGEGSFS
jgi:hypothetical protein